MTPDELDIVERDGQAIAAMPGRFAQVFYDTLFEVAPETRRLFPDDMADQRGRLVGELLTLVAAAAAWRATGSLDTFVGRARQLGARHVGYGVVGPMYDAVETSLLAALEDGIDGFDEHHVDPWTKLYRLVSETMREGALDA